MPFSAPESDLQPVGKTAFGDPIVGATPVDNPHRAQDLTDAVVAGLQSSSLGLALRGKLPDQILGEDAPWYQRLASNAAGIVGDIPAMIVGSAAGKALGSAAGPVGAGIGSFAGGMAAPMALREALVEAYSNNHALSWSGVFDIAKAGLTGGTKGAIIGAATGGAGRIAGPLVGGSALRQGTAALGAELAALTTTSAALEGHMPTWQDFMDNAILLGGLKGAAKIATGLHGAFVETGKTPAEIAADAMRDPAIKEALEKGELPKAYEPIAVEERVKAAIDKDPRPDQIRKALTNDPTYEPGSLVDWQYVTDSETAQGVLKAVTERYSTEIEEQRRGTVTNAASVREAESLLNGGLPEAHKIGEAGNSGEILARAALLRDALNNARDEVTKLKSVPEADLTPAMKLKALAAIERVAMLNSEFAGVRAEAGRALQIFRAIKRDPNLVDEANALVRLAERKGDLQDIAAMVERFKSPEQMAAFAREYVKATTFEKVMEAWKAAILSGPQTHLANVLGNTGKLLLEVPESALSATLYAAGRAIKGDPLTLAQYKARAFAPWYGLQFGAKESLYTAAEVWRGQGPRVEKADIYRPAIEGKVGEIVRLPFKALQVEDVFFRTFAERAEAYKLAVDRATKEGLHPDTAEFREAVVRYTERPDFGLTQEAGQAVINQVQQAGAEGVFAQRLGPFLEMTQAAIAQHAPALQFVIPFVRTPANLVSWAVQHTPILNLLSGRWREDFAAGGERRARALARVTIGAGIAMTAMSMAQSGALTGGGMFDKEQGATKRAAGWQPYSVKIGDKYYSYQRMEPVGKVLGLAADFYELLTKADKEEDKLKIAGMLVLMFGNATVSTTYLSGVSGALQSLTDPERYAGNFLEQYATSLVPKIVGQAAAMKDPYKREVDGTIEAIQSQIPFLREKLLPKRDVWGEPVRNDRWFDAMPVATSEVSHDKVKTEAVRLEVAIADAPKYSMERGPFNAKDKRVTLTAEQRDVFREVAGKNAMAILGPIVNADDWSRIPDFAKAEIYKHVIEGTRKQGQYAALPPDAEARDALRRKIVDRIIKETTESQGK